MINNAQKIEESLYGYCIGEHLQFRVSPALLVNTFTGTCKRLRPTMARLLQYILCHSGEVVIEDKKIMEEVFENHGLKCNKQRLWQAINSLKDTLLRCGFNRMMIYRVNKNGFLVSDIHIKVLIIYRISDVYHAASVAMLGKS